jgi:hypothetical protein
MMRLRLPDTEASLGQMQLKAANVFGGGMPQSARSSQCGCAANGTPACARYVLDQALTRRTDGGISAASVIIALTCGTAIGAEFATKAIKEQSPNNKAYAEFTNKDGRFHD